MKKFMQGVKKVYVVAVIGLGLMMGRAFAADIYVDQRAEGSAADGSQNAPYVTIQAGVNAAVAGDTVWVKSGDGRDYAIVDDASAVSIPEEKSGLTLRGWGDERVLISCTNEYEYTTGDDGVINWINKTVAPLKIAAPNVVVRDLRLTYKDKSLTDYESYNHVERWDGTNYVALVMIESTATNLKMENCEVEALELGTRWGAGHGYGAIIVGNAQGCLFANCRFISTRVRAGTFDGYGENQDWTWVPYAVFGFTQDFTLVGNYFTNVSKVVNVRTSGWDDRIDMKVVSNKFVNCPTSDYLGGCVLFQGVNKGIGLFECSYNIFYNDETMTNRSNGIIVPEQRSIKKGFDFHHNTVVGWKYLYIARNPWEERDVKFYDNLVWLRPDGVVYWDQKFEGEPITNEQGRVTWTTIKEGSYFRNNVIREGLPIFADIYFDEATYGEGKWDKEYAYSLLTNKATVVDNIFLSEAPVFVSMDPENENFMKAKQNKNRLWADKRYAWGGEDGTAELFIGAKPIIRDAALVIRVQ